MTIKRLFLAALFTWLSLPAFALDAATDRQKILDSISAKPNSILKFQSLARGGMLDPSGTKSNDNFADADLVQPLPSYVVRYEALQRYEPSQDASLLLMDLGEIVFLVQSEHRIVSTATLKRLDGKWQPTRFGTPKLAHELDREEGPLAAELRRIEQQLPPSERTPHILVNIADLGAMFIGTRTPSGLLLTAVRTNKILRLEQATTASAGVVFSHLKDVAKELK